MIVSAENIQKRYGKVQVLQDLDLQVPEGSAFALVGSNGAGKTTTLRMLVNIIQPDSGVARIAGVPTQELTYKHYERIGYVSED